MSETAENNETPKKEVPAEPRFALVRGDGKRVAQEIIVGPHKLGSDEPAPVGTDTGPTPYDLLISALGACTATTLTMYASRKEWPLESINVVLRHAKIHAEDCAECETKEGKVDRIERAIELGGPLSQEQRDRLLEIANKCPMHRTLKSEINIQTKLA